jgi:hypothetical protein
MKSIARSVRSISPAVILSTVVLSLWIDHAAGQEISLTPLQATEVAKGYRAEALKPVVNEKNETIGESMISFLARMATFTLSLPSKILPDLVAT